MSDVKNEKVMVVPTEVFHQLGHFQGFSAEVDRYVGTLLDPTHLSFRPRGEVETDPSFKQLIPYVLFLHENGDGQKTIFEYVRSKKVGEGRLKSKRSVGIGGHISSEDVQTGSAHPFEEGMRRELEEEVTIDTPYKAQCVGMINDDENEVGRVHLGMVYIFNVESPNVEISEDELIESGFKPVDELLANLDGFETWSSITLEALFGKSAA
ncbi:MAG: phosphoesterase [Planctomycetia bacterium]